MEANELCSELGEEGLMTTKLGCMVQRVWEGSVESDTCQWAVGDAAHVAMMVWEPAGAVTQVWGPGHGQS